MVPIGTEDEKNYSMPNMQTVFHIVYKSKQASRSSYSSDLHRSTVYRHHQNGIRQLALGVA